MGYNWLVENASRHERHFLFTPSFFQSFYMIAVKELFCKQNIEINILCTTHKQQ